MAKKPHSVRKGMQKCILVLPKGKLELQDTLSECVHNRREKELRFQSIKGCDNLTRVYRLIGTGRKKGSQLDRSVKEQARFCGLNCDAHTCMGRKRPTLNDVAVETNGTQDGNADMQTTNSCGFTFPGYVQSALL